ncbi:mucosal addressin cell adhesion molecule 1 isoform X2 [Eublepharis macularius]|uniref:Mucosal addressin cell adhesion molecule 1 isoform X2 n=1 Tax=Eublepharis macularius TaxID=481883 RepID=A0AA97JF78_EUBMA|nr:mucosal addressin cell adhesion molecule 1 isoform X2 [Eublepharis macularius]
MPSSRKQFCASEDIYPGGKEMETLLLGLLLSLLWNCDALPLHARTRLTIHPKEPVVEVGGSVRLHCSMDCPGGKVQWEGLDTDLGDVISNGTSSILTVTNAAVRMEGMKICMGQCEGKSFQKTVELQVYSLPDTLQLDSQPEVPRAGQTARLFCSVSHVYPAEAFTLSWFQGDHRVQCPVEEDMEDSELFTFHSKLEIPVVAEHTTYRCEAKLQIGEHLFLQSRMVTIHAQAPQEIRTTTKTTTSHSGRPVTATDGSSSLEALTRSLPTLHSTEHSTILMPVAITTVAPILESTTSPAIMINPSTGSLSPAANSFGKVLTVSSEPLDGALRTSAKLSMFTLTPVTETLAKLGVVSQALPTTDQQPAAKLVSTTNDPPAKSSVATRRPPNHTVEQATGLCRPVITPFPPQGTMGGTLHITCHAVECHEDVQVRWEETPVAQSQYHQEKAEGQSTLTVDSVSLEHQGVYRCIVMTSQPRMASLRVIVTAGMFNTNTIIAIGAAGSLLGLIVTSYVFRRVWQQRGS